MGIGGGGDQKAQGRVLGVPSPSQWETWWWQKGSEGETPGLGSPSLGSLRVDTPPGCKGGLFRLWGLVSLVGFF